MKRGFCMSLLFTCVAINFIFWKLMFTKQDIPVELICIGDNSDFYPYALSVHEHDNDRCLISYGTPIDKIYYTPMYCFYKEHDWLLVEYKNAIDNYFFTLHPIVKYGELSGDKHIYKILIDENINISIPILE